MKLKSLFLLCLVAPLFLLFSSCTPSQDNIVVDHYLKAYVEDSFFEADDIAVLLEGNTFQVIGNNTKTNESIFLVFSKGDETVYTFGTDSEAVKASEASLYNKSLGNEYSTSLMQQQCGQLKLDISQWEYGVLAGDFYFEAIDGHGDRVKISAGKFQTQVY